MSQLWCIKLFIVAVQHTLLTSSRSAQPTLIGSSAPLRPEQPRYRELGPSSEDGLSLSGSRRVELSAPSTPTRPSALLSKLICSSLRLTINFFYFYFTIFWHCNARSAGFNLVWPGTITFYNIISGSLVVLVFEPKHCYKLSAGPSEMHWGKIIALFDGYRRSSRKRYGIGPWLL